MTFQKRIRKLLEELVRTELDLASSEYVQATARGNTVPPLEQQLPSPPNAGSLSRPAR